MDQPQGGQPAPGGVPASPTADRHVTGPLSREAAGALLDRGAALLETGEFGEALATYQRVVGFDDPEVTAAALLGMAQSRYRMDDEDGALRIEPVRDLVNNVRNEGPELIEPIDLAAVPASGAAAAERQPGLFD